MKSRDQLYNTGPTGNSIALYTQKSIKWLGLMLSVFPTIKLKRRRRRGQTANGVCCGEFRSSIIHECKPC